MRFTVSAKIGIVGGVGWPGTALYYEALCRAAAKDGGPGSPHMTIESLDMARTLAARGVPNDDRSWHDFDLLFSSAINRLQAADCGLAAIASVTPHARLAAITEQTRIPIISILEAVEAQLQFTGARQVLVLGTAITMAGNLFASSLEKCGSEKLLVSSADISEFAKLLETHFYLGEAEEGRYALLDYVGRFVADPSNTVVLLGCTDLAPAFPETAGGALFATDGFQFLDATTAHVSAILAAAEALSEQHA